MNMSAYLAVRESPVDPPMRLLHNCTETRKR